MCHSISQFETQIIYFEFNFEQFVISFGMPKCSFDIVQAICSFVVRSLSDPSFVICSSTILFNGMFLHLFIHLFTHSLILAMIELP